jgi:hypothetical protein
VRRVVINIDSYGDVVDGPGTRNGKTPFRQLELPGQVQWNSVAGRQWVVRFTGASPLREGDVVIVPASGPSAVCTIEAGTPVSGYRYAVLEFDAATAPGPLAPGPEIIVDPGGIIPLSRGRTAKKAAQRKKPRSAKPAKPASRKKATGGAKKKTAARKATARKTPARKTAGRKATARQAPRRKAAKKAAKKR